MRLSDRDPQIGADELIEGLVPPPRFNTVSFDTYIPNPDEPSQAAAVEAGRLFAARVSLKRKKWSLFGGKEDEGKLGLYLDGGFGVGKTHLLASLWHAVPGPKAYGTFVELTNLVGVLTFPEAVKRLSGHKLLAIDEFELDDPGDTMLVTRLIKELVAQGVFIAATSNTLPDKLGEGRFAAADFLREIQSMSSKFDVVRVDGPDYRHRGLPEAPSPMSDTELIVRASNTEGSTIDDFDDLCKALARIHPSKYGRLLDGVTAVHLKDVKPAPDQSVGLRLVAFGDRLYDRDIPVAVSGQPLSELFTEEMLKGGYRKKYLRAVSRLVALSRV